MSDRNFLNIIKPKDSLLFTDPRMKVTIDDNGKQVDIPGLRSMTVDSNLDEVISAKIEVIDVGLDLLNVPFEVKVDELG